MSLYRRAARRDAAEPTIIHVLEAMGWTVQQLSIPGGPDLLLGRQQETHLAEVKSGNRPLQPGQAGWHANWRGAPVIVLRSEDDAYALSQGQWPRVQERKTALKARRQIKTSLHTGTT